MVHCAKKLNSDLPGSAQCTAYTSFKPRSDQVSVLTGFNSSTKGPGRLAAVTVTVAQLAYSLGTSCVREGEALLSVVEPSGRQDAQ